MRFGNDRGLAEFRFPLLVHFEEQKAGDLLDIVAVGDAGVAQNMRVVPDLADQAVVIAVHALTPTLALERRVWPREGEASRSPAMRASRVLAGSSAGSCGTSLPEKAAL